MDYLNATPDPDFSGNGTRRRKTARWLPVALGSLVALAVCLGLVFMLVGGAKDPREALEAAFAATERDSLKRGEALVKDIPALGLLDKASGWARQDTDWTLTFKGIEGVDGAQQINALFGQSALTVQSQIDSDQGVAQVTAMLTMLGREFFGFYGYLSPQTMAFGLPGLTETTPSVDLASLTEDYAASSWYDAYTAEQLEAMRASLAMWAEGKAAQSGNWTPDVLMAAWNTLLDAGTYTREGGSYTVTLPGEAARAFALEVVWYFAENGMGAADTYTRETFMQEAERALPPLPVTARFETDDKGVITRFEVTTPVFDVPDAELFSVELALSGTRADSRTEIGLTATWLDWADDPCGMEGTFVLEADGGRWKLTGDAWLSDGYDALAGTLLAEITADGGFVVQIGLDESEGEGALSVLLQGTITEQGEAVVIDMPECVLSFDDGWSSAFSVAFGLKQTVAPAADAIAPSRIFTPLFAMTEDEMMAMVGEVMASLEGLFGAFSGF